MANMELIDPVIDAKHRSRLSSGELHDTLRLRTFDDFWTVDPRWTPRLRAAGLLPLAQLLDPRGRRSPRFPVDRALLTAWVDRWRPETHTFHLTVGEMTPTLQDVAMLLGLPIAGVAVVPPAVNPAWMDDILERFAGVLPPDAEHPQFGFHDKHGPSKMWVEQFRAERLTVHSEDWRVRRHLEAYLLWLFGWVMFTSTHQDSVDKRLIPIAQQIADTDPEQMPQYSWGSAVLAATYKALCEACRRTTSAGSLTGCPLLLMLWSFERVDIGRPKLSSYDAYEDDLYDLDDFELYDPLGGPTMGSIWCKRDPRWATGAVRKAYPQFVADFDQLTADRVRWMPYTADEVARRAPRGLSGLCTRDSAFWLTRRLLVFDICVEPYAAYRVLRQFGLFQDFPLPRLQLDHSHTYNRKGQGLGYEGTWAAKMEPWREQWVGAETDVHVPQGPYDPFTYREYIQWFNRATRVRLLAVALPPVDHVPEITDTFATQPTQAFHQMADTCDDIAGELEDWGSRCYDNPPRVEPRDLGAALLRLARRCREALRCVSCRSTTDVHPRQRRRSPPASTPASAPGSSRFHAGDSSTSMPPAAPPFMPTPGWNAAPAVQFAAPDYSLHSASGSFVHEYSYGEPDVQDFFQMPGAPLPTQPTQQFLSTPLEGPRERHPPDHFTYPTDQIRRPRRRAQGEASKRARHGG